MIEVSNERINENLIFRSCDIFSGFCDTALLIFGVFELISP